MKLSQQSNVLLSLFTERKTLIGVTLVLTTLASGCANEPIIDRRGVDPATYQADLAECRSYAAEVNTPVEGAKGGAVGAVVGGAIGAVLGNHHTAERGAGGGAVIGSTKGMTKAEERKERVMYNCMKGRGYRVLG